VHILFGPYAGGKLQMSASASANKRNLSPEQALVVGVGNPLLGDEGIGCHIIEKLSRMAVPSDICILDCGCDLLNLVFYIKNA
jgi:hypothetical protein